MSTATEIFTLLVVVDQHPQSQLVQKRSWFKSSISSDFLSSVKLSMSWRRPLTPWAMMGGSLEEGLKLSIGF